MNTLYVESTSHILKSYPGGMLSQSYSREVLRTSGKCPKLQGSVMYFREVANTSEKYPNIQEISQKSTLHKKEEPRIKVQRKASNHKKAAV